MPEWLLSWAKRYTLLPTYITAVIRFWQNFLWGESVLAAAMIVYIALVQPRAWIVGIYFLFVMFLAGYLVWRTDHIRLMPKFAVNELIAHRATAVTSDLQTDFHLFVQIVPECLTDAPVQECRGELLRVSKKSLVSSEWEETGMNFPLVLGWDCYGIERLTLQPGIKRRLNVCWWTRKDMFIIPAVEPLTWQHKTVFDSSGTFKFDIKLTAKDCSPVDVSVTVNLDDRIWDKPKLTLIQASGFSRGLNVKRI